MIDTSLLMIDRIEETWRLWERFHLDHQRFSDFLTEADKGLCNPKTDNTTFTVLKAELKSFEVRGTHTHTHRYILLSI